MNNSHAASALEVLANAVTERIASINLYDDGEITETDDENENDSPIYGMFFEEEGCEGIIKMTNFSPTEPDELFDLVKPEPDAKWNKGRGKKCRQSVKDVFSWPLSVVKRAGTWDYMG